MTWQPYLADDYIDQDGVEALCRDLAAHAPEWVDLREIGTSGLGRPILMLVIGHQDGDDTRPGVWIDAGTHASEFTSVSAAMFTISRWVK